jgi:hypothetical protein
LWNYSTKKENYVQFNHNSTTIQPQFNHNSTTIQPQLKLIILIFFSFGTLNAQKSQPLFELKQGQDYIISRSYIDGKTYYHLILEKRQDIKTGFVTLKNQNYSITKGCQVNIITSADKISEPLINKNLTENQIYYFNGESQIITNVINFSNTTTIGIVLNCDKIDFKDIKLFSLINSTNDSTLVLNLKDIPDGPHPQKIEICNNGKDDDLDGKIDCEDEDCFPPSILDILKINPTCPICEDGRIIVTTDKGGLISIDGGNIWVWTNGYIIFDNLNPGTFSIIIKNKNVNNDCGSNNVEIVLTAPIGKEEYCNNGSFEQGNFINWQGLLGEFRANNIQLNPGFDLNNRHTIIPDNPNLSDPNVGNNIPLISPTGGVYFMRLGNLTADNLLNAQGIRYQFNIDNTNKDFRFWYAVVVQAFHDDININPRFRYRMNDAAGNTIFDSQEIQASLNDPFFIHHEGTTIYKGWTCVNQDLTAFVGQTVTFEFYITDCSDRGHFGYAYLDGLCSKLEDLKITCDASKIFCENQSPNIQIVGTGYNQYKWTISKKNSNGQLYDTKEIEKIGYNASNNDILQEYFNQGVTFECVEYYFKLEVYSDCGGHAECSFTSNSSCNSYDFNYCEYLFICTQDPFITIPGSNNCTGCTYSWSPSYYFEGTSNQQNPTINSKTFTDARNRTYEVTITTPEQCVYNKEVNLIHFPSALQSSSIVHDYCTFEGNYMLKFPFSVPDDLITVNYYSADNTDSGVTVLDHEKSDTKQKHFIFTSDRPNKNTIYYVDYSINPSIPSNCKLGDCERFQTLLGTVNGSNWHYPWRMFVPNTFSPNGDSKNDIFHPFPWSPTDLPECKSEKGFSSSIYYAKLSIFYRWGGVILEQEITYNPNDNTGFKGNELFWDGTFNGQPVENGVYVWVLEINSCSDTYTGCNNDPSHVCDNQTGFCSINSQPHRILSGNITVNR